MWTADAVVSALEEQGELWRAGPGLTGLRGNAGLLFGALGRVVGELVATETRDEWLVPAGIDLAVLARAEYFASFPQWLTLAAHLDDDETALERVATAADPAEAARTAMRPAGAALPPAVCYHLFAALAGRILESPARFTAQGTCWRHEGARHVPLERGWAFTMREMVCLGTEADTTAFRARGIERARDLARMLGLDATLAEAGDPFFAPTARGKATLQRIKALKHELLLPIGGERRIAAASFNLHERFFGDAFAIRLPDGGSAWSACVAFGIERWLLAFLCQHGPDPLGWPDGWKAGKLESWKEASDQAPQPAGVP